jgi:hypothetical protein
MSNPSGDSTILGLPTANPLNGSEAFPIDQLQSGTLVTVKVFLSSLLAGAGLNWPVGTTAQRPATPVLGQPYLDLTLGLPIWCIQTSPSIKWVNASGFGPL